MYSIFGGPRKANAQCMQMERRSQAHGAELEEEEEDEEEEERVGTVAYIQERDTVYGQ